MPITEAQRQQRSKHIGGSDVPAILGLDSFRNAYDVWLQKTGKLIDDDGSAPSEAAQLGTDHESGVLTAAERELGPLVRNQYRSAPEYHLGVNCDALVRDDGQPVEAKVEGIYRQLREGWGTPGTDEVPDNVIVQVHAQMICTATELAHVAALLGGRGFQMFAVSLNPKLADLIRERCARFWEYNVVRDIPPENVAPTLDVVKRARRVPAKVATIPAHILQVWRNCKEFYAGGRYNLEQAEAKLLAAMGDAEAAVADDASGAVTYYESQRKGYTVEPCTYRALRFKAKGLEKPE